MASTSCQGKTSKKIIRPVVVGLQLLIVNIHVLQDDQTAKISTTEGQENISGKSFDWFQEDQFLGILRSLKPVLMSRMNCPQPTSSKQNYQRQIKELKSIANVVGSYNFKKRPNIPGQHFVLQKSENIYCLCGKKITKKNVNYKSYPIFYESLEIIVKKCVQLETENHQSDSMQKTVKEIKECKLKDVGTSNYFGEQTDCLQTSSVKRKRTTLRKIPMVFRAKKSRIALIELPSYKKSKSQVVLQEDLELEPTSSRNHGCKPGPVNTKATTATVIDLEKEPEGLKNISKVEDLRDDHLKFLINQMEDYLRTIFRGEVYCRRHEDYKKGGKFRDDLNFQVGMAHFSEDQHECILSSLVAMFCYKDTKYLDYVTKVMLPEALIKMYQDIHKTSFEEAEECLFNDTIRDN